MASSIFIGLINNAALLLAFVFCYDAIVLRRLGNKHVINQVLTGILVGAAGIVVMLSSWEYFRGLVFDARSVLLCVSGLFFGAVPTLTAMVITGAYRCYLGGAGMWVGIAVIFTSGVIGLAWRQFSRKKPGDLSFGEIFLLGVAVHIGMLFWMFAFPGTAARRVLLDMGVPVLVIFSFATAAFGKLLAGQDERKRMGNRLEESETRYRRIVETANLGIGTVDAQFRVTYVNHILAKSLGCDPGEIIGRPMTGLLFEEDLSDHMSKVANRRSGHSVNYDRRFRRKDGRTLWTNVSATPLFDENNNFSGAFAMFIDITDRKKAEFELKESEALFRTLFEQAAVGVAQVETRTGRFIRINRRYCDIVGYEPAEMMTKTFQEITHPSHLQADLDSTKLLLKGKIREYSKEKRYCRKDGSVVWVNLTVSPMWAPGEEPDYHIAIVEDITQRKEAENALRESEKILNDTGRMAKIGGWEHDLRTGRAIWTRALYDIIEFEGSSPPGPNEHLDYYLPEDRRILEEAYWKCVKQGEPFDLELQGNTAKGRPLWCRATGEPVFENGVCVKLRGTFQDITERKRSEEALKDEARRRRILFEQSRDGIVILDENGKVYEANRQYADMLGYTLEEIHHLHVWDWDAQWTREELLEMVKTVGASGDHFETRQRRKDGAIIDVEISTNGVEFGTGKLVFCICREITERKKAERERKQYESQLYLAQKHEAIGTLAGGIAHDFNNILSSIIGFTELSLDEADEETELHQNLSEVLVAALRARELIRQILTFTRQSKSETRPIQINSLVKEAMNMLRATIPTSIRIETHLSEKLLTIIGDPTQMHQVIINLATNASHAMAEDGGVMGITVEPIRFDGRVKHHYPELEAGSYARISVSDTGHGIKKEHIQNIFDPYFSTKTTDQGSGLGLAVVQGIVRAHSGHITVYSEVGKGTTFNVYLPLAQKWAEEPGVLPTQKLPQGSERLLLVDDELPIVRMQKISLERMGYSVTSTTDSSDALETFKSTPDLFDLVITDMTMPGMTGDRLARAVKQIRPEVPVVLCTGFSEKLNDSSRKDMEIDAVLMKPVDKTKLAETIRNLLDQAKNSG